MAASQTIGVIAPSLAGEFNVQVLSGIYQRTRTAGFNLLSIEATSQYVAERQLAFSHVSGWILLNDAPLVEGLDNASTPLVLISPTSDPGRHPLVRPDNYASARELIEHVIGHGHRTIGFIGTMTNSDILERYRAYEEALREHAIPLDPELVIDVDGYHRELAVDLITTLLQTRTDFTAIFCATDEVAIGVYEALQAAGLRIPEDVAVTGFDDMLPSQYLEPPLTTARQQPYDLGYQAASILLNLLDGTQPAQQITLAPTTPVMRQSCGCEQPDHLQIAASGLGHLDWSAWLQDRLLQSLYYPLPIPPVVDATHTAAIAALITSLERVVDGQPTSSAEVAAVQSAWSVLITQQSRPDLIIAMQAALRQAAAMALEATPAPSAQTLMAEWDHTIQASALQAALTSQRTTLQSFARLLQASYWLSMQLADSSTSTTQLDLAWIERLQIQASCVALWSATAPNTLVVNNSNDQSQQLQALRGTPFRAPDFPPQALIEASHGPSRTAFIICVPVRDRQRDWGMLVFGHNVIEQSLLEVNSLTQWGTLLSSLFERQALAQSLHSERQMLQLAYERERALASTIRELGCPLIPLMPGVLLVPLIGVIDTHRAQYITETVLKGVSQHKSRFMLLEMTGVPIVDTQVAGALLNIASASMLLGAKAVLIGVRPELAQTIVALGIDMHSLLTFPNLQAAVTGLRLT